MNLIISILQLLLLAAAIGVSIGVGMALICAVIVFFVALIRFQLPMDIHDFIESIKKLMKKIIRKPIFNNKTDITTSAISYDNKEYNFTINDYKRLLQRGKNTIIVNSVKLRFWDLYANVFSKGIKKQKSIVVVSTKFFPITREIVHEAEDKGFSSFFNPTYRDIQELDEDKSYFLIFTYDYDRAEDFITTLEYGCIATEKLLQEKSDILFIVEGIEKFYESSECKEVYESEFKDSLVSEATVIAVTDSIKENDFSRELLKGFDNTINLDD